MKIKNNLSVYSNSTVDIQIKASTLQTINIILLILLPVGAIFLNIFKDNITPVNIILIVIFLSVLLSLLFLHKGYYYSAANTIAVISIICLLAQVYPNMQNASVCYMSIFYYTPALIIFTSLFCKTIWVIIFTIMWFCGIVITHLTALSVLEGIQRQIAVTIISDLVFAVILVFAISLMLKKVNNQINRRFEQVADDNNNNYIKLENVISSLKISASFIAESSETISSTSKDFFENAQNQAASAEEVSAIVEEVNASAVCINEQITDQVNNINNLTSQIKILTDSIKRIESQVRESVNFVNNIALMGKSGEESLETMNDSISRIQDSSMSMNGIISIIRDIADQINLLSLNAAIEAARAGESGRGFAVVSDEISKLADRTTASVIDISHFIAENERELNAGMKNVAGVMTVLENIAIGVQSVTEKMKHIGEEIAIQHDTAVDVLNDGEKVLIISKKIQSAAEEQKNAVNEITNAFISISSISQNYANGARNLADNSVKLASKAEDMNKIVINH